jgi:hypothetical protein
MSDNRKTEYEVGYGKPPAHGRFQKGRSGNPKGRPKGAKGFLASVQRELERKITVREGNRTIRISKGEAAAMRAVELALKGDKAALRLLATLDGGYRERIDQTAGLADSHTGPDQTDVAILQHFAAMLADGHALSGLTMTPANAPEREDDDDLA